MLLLPKRAGEASSTIETRTRRDVDLIV